MVNVLLLREPSEDTSDSYEDLFRNAGYHPFPVSVLDTLYTNLTSLCDAIRAGPQANGLKGVVITSKRSCEAWGRALELLREEMKSDAIDCLAQWIQCPLYVVGERTASCLRDIFSRFSAIGPDIRGHGSGNAAKLADFILKDQNKPGTKLLYLTGDKNRDTITRILTDGNVSLNSLQVYMTQECPSFESNLTATLESSPKDASHWWIVYFAPSPAAFVTSTLMKYFHLPQNSSTKASGSQNLLTSRIAVIGPTTNSFLTGNLDLQVDVMAPKPTPRDLVDAVESFDRDNR